jgi:hypothetical protein
MFEEDHDQQMSGPWILQDVKDFGSWDSDEDRWDSWNSLSSYEHSDIDDAFERDDSGDYRFLGFHPYEEIVYLNFPMGRGIAYDWNNSKFHDLGSLKPEKYHCVQTDVPFPYTPCWMGEFSGNELEIQLEKWESEAQLEDSSNFTCMDEYELHKLRGRAKRVKDCAAKIRRRRRIRAR